MGLLIRPYSLAQGSNSKILDGSCCAPNAAASLCWPKPNFSALQHGPSGRPKQTCRCPAVSTQAEADTDSVQAPSLVQEAAADTADGIVRVSLPTSGLLSDVKLAQRSDGRMVIVGVTPGCYLEEAGLRSGMLILSIADPIRSGVMWPLDKRSSIRMVRHTLHFQHGRNVEIDLLPDGKASPASIPASPPRQQGSAPAGHREGSRPAPDRSEAAVRRRQQRRSDYMEQTSGKGNSRLLLIVASFVLIPPICILIAAIQSGYLDQLSSVYKGKY